MRGPPADFWGKLRGNGAQLEWHPLADHCADVAACAEALLRQTALGARIATLAGVERWSEEQVARLAVFAALLCAERDARDRLRAAGGVAA